MRIAIGSLLALVLAAGVTLTAKQCPSCYVLSAVDIPGAGSVANVGTNQPWGVAGWGFLCESGVPTTRVDLWWRDDSGVAHQILDPHLTYYWHLNRPDVVSAFVASCPNVYGQWTGYTVVVAGGAVPSGTRTIYVNVWVGPYYQQHQRTVHFD